MATLPAFRRQADRVEYTMLENKKRSFRDQKEAGRLPLVTVLENWRRELVAREEEDKDFQKANDELVAALKVARTQVGQPDPLAEEANNSPKVLENWIEKEKRKKQRKGEGRVTRSGRRIGGEAQNFPAVVPEESNIDDVKQKEAAVAPPVVDIPIGVPLGPEMLLALEALLLDVDLVVDEVQEPVESPATNSCRSRRFQVAEKKPMNDVNLGLGILLKAIAS
ncbi:unnamed protein product [Caenorhabditis brenneri]